MIDAWDKVIRDPLRCESGIRVPDFDPRAGGKRMQANVRIEVVENGVVTQVREAHNTINSSGLGFMRNRIWNGTTSTLWKGGSGGMFLRVYNTSGTQMGQSTAAATSSSRGGSTTGGRTAAENRIWLWSAITTTAAGRASRAEIRSGGEAVASVTFTQTDQLAAGATLNISWSISVSYNMTGNFNEFPGVIIRGSSSSSGRSLWSRSGEEAAVETAMAKMLHGDTVSPTQLGTYGVYRYYRLDPTKYGPDAVDGEEPPANPQTVQTSGTLDVVALRFGRIPTTGNRRLFRGTCPGFTPPQGRDAAAYRITWWKLWAGSSSSFNIAFAAGVFSLPERIPSGTNTAAFTPAGFDFG